MTNACLNNCPMVFLWFSWDFPIEFAARGITTMQLVAFGIVYDVVRCAWYRRQLRFDYIWTHSRTLETQPLLRNTCYITKKKANKYQGICWSCLGYFCGKYVEKIFKNWRWYYSASWLAHRSNPKCWYSMLVRRDTDDDGDDDAIQNPAPQKLLWVQLKTEAP